MSAVLLGTAEVHSPEWHALRAGGIGGSDIAAVLGLSRWTSPFQLWHRKRGNLPEQPLSSAMDWGNRLEPLVRDWFAEQHPEFHVEATPGTYAHEDRPWQRVNPDGLLYPPVEDGVPEPLALLEIKTSRFGDGFTRDDIPLDYMCQVQWSLDVFGLDVAHVVVLVGGNDPREYVIKANPEDQATLRAAAEKFWNSIQADEQPPLDCTDHTYEAVRDLNPLIDKDLVIDLPGEVWHRYVAAKAAIDAGEGELTFAKAEILHLMGAARVARFAKQDVLRRQLSSAKKPYLKEVV